MKRFTFSLLVQSVELYEVEADTEQEARDLLEVSGGAEYLMESYGDVEPIPGAQFMLEQEEDINE